MGTIRSRVEHDSAPPSICQMDWARHVEGAIHDAHRGRSRLTPEVRAVPGLTSTLVRHFLNIVCGRGSVNYLEIGSWKGATITAASCNNVGRFTAVDDFSQWADPGQFYANRARCERWCRFDFLDRDSWQVDPAEISPDVDVYFYDGEHSYESQVRAFVHFDPALAGEFVAVVDDWNYPQVRAGTQAAFAELGYDVLRDWELPARWDGDAENWWNGLYVAIVRKGRSGDFDRGSQGDRGPDRSLRL
jgi:hypothetical protein